MDDIPLAATALSTGVDFWCFERRNRPIESFFCNRVSLYLRIR
jgi:hypothetical protein